MTEDNSKKPTYTFWTILRGTIALSWGVGIIIWGLWGWRELFNGNSEHLGGVIPLNLIMMVFSLIGIAMILNFVYKLLSGKVREADKEFFRSMFGRD